MNDSTCIVIFAKAPIAGFAKTRLIPALGEQGAAELARQLLQHAVQQAAAAQAGPIELCVTPNTVHPDFAVLEHEHGVLLSLQGSGDLGERMHRAFERVLASHSSAILIGTDAPALDAPLLLAAQQALRTHDAVFVPAHDGGYALVGLRRPCEAIFHDMTWSTSTVMQETRRRAQNASIRWHELPPVHDIDEPQDLIHVPAHLPFSNPSFQSI
ncbi:MAG: TIGR04282 family arsenosugar biosynthesis glycosyltransferase [Rhodoferax sp.]|nr:TIGR04282 family arsenosugar biosynthesis glycosyltransferase [Rhodoferax sp.]